MRIAALLALVLAFACTSEDERIRRTKLQVRQAIAQGDQQGARAALDRLRETARETPEDVRELADLMIRAGEAPQALWLLEGAVERFPERDDLRLAFSRVALMLGEAARAQGALEPIESDSLLHPDALVLRARASLDLGQLQEALDVLEEAERLYPSLPAGHRLRMQILFQEERFDEAREVLEEARSRAGTPEEARELDVLEAQILGARGDEDEALALLERVVKESPELLSAWTSLVRALGRMGRLEEAARLLRAAIDEDPERLALYPILANVQGSRGLDDEAEALLRDLIERAPSPSAYLTLARFHLERSDRERMLEVVERAIEEFPEQPMLEALRVEALLDLGRPDAAGTEIEKLAARIGDRPRLEYLRGRLELARGDAAAAAERLRRLAPHFDRAETQLYLGRALEAQGDFEGASRRYDLARQRDPASPIPALESLDVAQKRRNPAAVARAARALLPFPDHRVLALKALGSALLRLGNLDGAEEIARSFADRFPDEVDAHVLLFQVLWRQDRNAEAKEVIDAARERLGLVPRLATEHALHLATSGRVAEGIALLEDRIEQSPDADLLRTLAALHFQNGDYESGSAVVDRALERRPDDPRPLRLRIEYAAARGPLEAARRDAERYLELRPRDGRIHYVLGTVYERLDLTDRAIRAYRRAGELDERAYEPRNNLAVLLHREGELDGALEAAHAAYERAETSPDVLDTLGWIYFDRGLVERSVALLEEAHRASPDSADTRLHLALAYRETGRTDEARRLLSELVAGAGTESEIRGEAQNALRTLP